MTYYDQLQPIETAPRDGSYILLFGPSGYITTPLRCEVGYFDVESAFKAVHPNTQWRNHANNWFMDGGSEPTHWLPLPKL